MASFGNALWAALVGALAVLYAWLGAGWPPRRSAIAFMMGSWGARLAIQALYTRTPVLPFLTSYFRLVTFAVLGSMPALFAALNADESFSWPELAAAALWLIAFAAETTADRRRFRVLTIWLAFALFAAGSPWGWIALVCPAALIYLRLTPRY